MDITRQQAIDLLHNAMATNEVTLPGYMCLLIFRRSRAVDRSGMLCTHAA